VYYIIKGTARGEQILFQGERLVLLELSRSLRSSQPYADVRVTDRPVDVYGNCLLQKARDD
jgi:hypothetical protein